MKYAIGVDLGGTKIEAALVSSTGKKLYHTRYKTEVAKGWQQMLANLETAVKDVKKNTNKKIEGIGMGTPGFVHNNSATENRNVPGIDKVINDFVKKHRKVKVENDANCFAIAEHKLGAGKKHKNIVGVIWGTGIGGGIIVNDKLYKGAIGGAGGFAGMIIDHNKITNFSTGVPGTWEGLASGPDIIRRYLKYGGKKENNHVPLIWKSNDRAAKKIKKETLKFMGAGLGNIVSLFNPEIIVMGGGVSNLPVYRELNSEMRKYTNPISGKACKIVKNKLGDSAGVLGAAALVFSR